MKRILCLLILLMLFTGCSVNRLNYGSYLDTVYKVFFYNTNLENVYLDGYHYYIPKGLSFVEKRDTNSVLKYGSTIMYLYVDVTSYYHKTDLEYKKVSDIYYSENISYDGKNGYLQIVKLDDRYFVEFMYNYAKFEAHVSFEQMNDVIYQMSLILSSINYNDKILESIISNNVLQYKEEKFNILKPKSDREDTNYLDFDYNQVYEDYQGEIKDEDSIEIIEDEER